MSQLLHKIMPLVRTAGSTRELFKVNISTYYQCSYIHALS